MLECNLRHIDEVTILDLKGRMSLSESAFHPGSGTLGETVRDLIKKGSRKVLLNLKEVDYIDSSGIGEIVGALTSMERHGGELRLLSPAPLVRQVLKTTRLLDVFDIHENEGEALHSFTWQVAAAAV